MKTEYTVGNLRIGFESRARRRWFVVLAYAVLAAFDVVWGIFQSHGVLSGHEGWIISWGLILAVALLLVFSWLTGDMRVRGDERETHRREHAYSSAYPVLGYFLIGALFAGYFSGPNPITPLMPLAMRPLLTQLPYMLLGAAGIVYVTLPQAILLWSEPDMEADAS